MASLQLLRQSDLLAFIDSAAFLAWPVLPISRHRARSHAANPRALEEDVLLILAMDGEEMVGYLGVLPDELVGAGGLVSRVAWMSCIWTHPRMRGQGIAELLVKAALQAYEGRLLATSFTAPAKKLYDKLGAFAPLARVAGCRLYRRFGLAYLFGERYPKLKPLLLGVDAVANLLADRRWWFRPTLPAGYKLSFTNRLSAEAISFIAGIQGGGTKMTPTKLLFRRGPEELNWILSAPWVLESPAPDKDSERYAFSSLSRSFSLGVLEVWVHHELKAVCLYSLREGHFQLPYAYVEPAYTPALVQVLTYCWRLWGVHTASLFQAELVASHFSGLLLRRPFVKEYLLGCTALAGLPPQPYGIQPGDGDGAFT